MTSPDTPPPSEQTDIEESSMPEVTQEERLRAREDAQRPVDPYAWWHRALAGEKIGGPTLPVHDGDARHGFYRRRMKRGGPFVPVAIFEHEGELVALVNGEVKDPEEQWTYCCQHPVTETAYRHAVDTGHWPDADEAVTAPPAPEGHNAPEDEAEAIKDQIDNASANIELYSEIGDDEQAAKAQSLRSRLLELSREADKLRKEEKQPHLDASKAVDARWQPLVKAAKFGADTIAKALGAFETKKARAEAEARRKAEEEARKSAPADTPAEPSTPPETPAPKTQIKGGYGRAATVKAVTVITDVTDWPALLTYLSEEPQLRELARKLGQRHVDAGEAVPGVATEEQRRVA